MTSDDSALPVPRPFDAADHLSHPAVVRAFLWNAVATGDAETIRRAEAAIARAAAQRKPGAERRDAETPPHERRAVCQDAGG